MSPSSAADLRLVPHYVAPCCSACGTRLVLVDRGEPIDEIWWDEWECIAEGCATAGHVVMDWPERAMERLLDVARWVDFVVTLDEAKRLRGCQPDKVCDTCGAPWAETWFLFVGGRRDLCLRCSATPGETGPDREPEGPEIP